MYTVKGIIYRFNHSKTLKSKARSGQLLLLTQAEKWQILRKTKKTTKFIALKFRTQVESEPGECINSQTTRNILQETGYSGCTARRKPYISKINRKKPVCHGEVHENDSHEFWWTFVFTDERKFTLIKSDGQEKAWRRKNSELGDKNLTMLNTMDNGAAEALNGLDDLCFYWWHHGPLSLHQYFEVSPRHELRNMVLTGKQFFTLDN